MSAIKRFLEDAATMVHTGNRLELEDLLTGWRDDQKAEVLFEAIELSALISPKCNCLAHNLKEYAESNDSEERATA